MTLEAETDAAAGVLRAKRAQDGRKRTGEPALADPTARESLRRADPILRELIDARPDFHPRAWLDELPALAERFLDGELSDESLARMTDEEIEAALTEVPGVEVAERWRPYRSLAVSCLFASQLEKGT